MQNYINRSIEAVLKKAAKNFPAVILTGPRQSGKTTLVKKLFQKSHTYTSLDHPNQKLQAINDPKLFLKNYPTPLIIDEVQYAPTIFSYLKIAIDQNRQQTGQFILTGSQLFPLMAKISDSLAGRIAVLNLLPLSIKEVDPKTLDLPQLKKLILTGGFPELHSFSKTNHQLWFSSYIQTYLERDVRQIKQVSSLTEFQKFLQLAAANNGQIINLTNFSNDLGISVNTIKSWLSILEATGQISLIRPYYRNKGKRLIKSPKLYFLDTGLFCHLIGLTNPHQIFSGHLSGVHLETLVVSELYKHFYNQGLQPKIYYWRTSNQQEIDLIIEHNSQIVPLEIKLTASPNLSLTKSLSSFIHLFQLKKGYLLNLGDKKNYLTNKIVSLPIQQLLKIFS